MSTHLTTKAPAESYGIAFDFSNLLDTVTTATCSVELISGTDPTPAALLSGAAAISGTRVVQRVLAGVSGCDYRILCTASDGDDIFVLHGQLPVRAPA